MISANAHNLWWLPTLLRGRWIQDSEPLVFGIAYRWVALALVGLVMTAALGRLRPKLAPPEPYLLTALLATGWFFVTPRAHENHAFFVLAFLATARPLRPALYALASTAILLNVLMDDPGVLGPWTRLIPSGPLSTSNYPALCVLNVGLYGLLIARLRPWVTAPDDARAPAHSAGTLIQRRGARAAGGG